MKRKAMTFFNYSNFQIAPFSLWDSIRCPNKQILYWKKYQSNILKQKLNAKRIKIPLEIYSCPKKALS